MAPSRCLLARINERAMRHFFHAEQWLPYPVEAVFAFFANPENLPPLMPAWQKARIERPSYIAPPPYPGTAFHASGAGGVVAGEGTCMTITFRPVPFSPIRMAWDAEITEFLWNDHFCDSQLRGPFAYWHHCHRLQAEVRDGAPGTLLRDEVEYEMRFGVLGELAQRLDAERQFRALFRFRHQRTAELLPLSNVRS